MIETTASAFACTATMIVTATTGMSGTSAKTTRTGNI